MLCHVELLEDHPPLPGQFKEPKSLGIKLEREHLYCKEPHLEDEGLSTLDFLLESWHLYLAAASICYGVVPKIYGRSITA